ncbi:hypothetical protein FRC04_007437 [Tulasnella sp. 424]|nr:hypothetical protein FRC04_007437 [Tulasnella sp. 424]KAG8975132.1 hypothetical protein FRC05_006300 [Tulasnella sp. 425]
MALATGGAKSPPKTVFAAELSAEAPNIPASTFTFQNNSTTALTLTSDTLVLGAWVKGQSPPNSLEPKQIAQATALSDATEGLKGTIVYANAAGGDGAATITFRAPLSGSNEVTSNSTIPNLGVNSPFNDVGLLKAKASYEYEDIAAAWDWNLIPGITTDYGATPLLCNLTQWSGNRTFVGGALDGKVDVAAMDYPSPYTGQFSYRKVWFFFPNDVQHVIVSDINKQSNATDVFHVLDQKRANGKVYEDGSAIKSARAVCYAFEVGQLEDHRNVCRSISMVATRRYQALDPISYSVDPGTQDATTFTAKAKQYPVTSFTDVSAAVNSAKFVLIGVFCNASSVKADLGIGKSLTVQNSNAAVVMVDLKKWSITVSDPTPPDSLEAGQSATASAQSSAQDGLHHDETVVYGGPPAPGAAAIAFSSTTREEHSSTLSDVAVTSTYNAEGPLQVTVTDT